MLRTTSLPPGAAGIPVILRVGSYTRVPAKELAADRVITDFLELAEAIRGVSGRELLVPPG